MEFDSNFEFRPSNFCFVTTCGPLRTFASGNVYGWGNNNYGELGNGSSDDNAHSTPVEVDPMHLTSIVAVAAGQFSSYALSSDGSLWVWGWNGEGQLGVGPGNEFDLPQHLLPPVGQEYVALDADADGDHAVALLSPLPEPGSLSLLAIGSLTLLRRRRRAAVG